MRIVGALVGVAVLFGAVVVLGVTRPAAAPPAETVLAVPAEGDVLPVLLDDGEPVFVVAHRAFEGGGVSVVGAIGPHMDIPVVWCPDDRRFYEPGPASMFDEEGSYTGGPAPEGLITFEVRVDADRPDLVHVGARRDARPRTHRPLQPVGPGCDWEVEEVEVAAPDGGTVTAHLERVVGAVGHDLEALYGPPIRPEDAVREPPDGGRFARLAGRLSMAPDGAMALCSPRAEPGCPPRSAAVRSRYADDARPVQRARRCVGDLDGEILARRSRTGFTDVAIMPPPPGVGVAVGGVAGVGYSGFGGITCVEGEGAHPAGLTEIVGGLAGVEPSSGAAGDRVWHAVLVEPVAARPWTDDEVGRRAAAELAPSDRWPFSATASVQLWAEDLGIEAWVAERFRVEGIQQRRAAKRLFTPAELAEVLEQVEVRDWTFNASTDAAGRILQGHLDTGLRHGAPPSA